MSTYRQFEGAKQVRRPETAEERAKRIFRTLDRRKKFKASILRQLEDLHKRGRISADEIRRQKQLIEAKADTYFGKWSRKR